MPTIMPAFDEFPKEGEIIGRLLAGYGELELTLSYCVTEARNDFNLVFKAMFRPRGETQRIQIADAIGREPMHSLKLGTLFDETIGAISYCLKIRNQYAHCYWTTEFGRRLGFVEMEEAAKANQPVGSMSMLKVHWLDVPTLEAQEEYFCHTHDCLWYLNDEVKIRAGRSSKSAVPAPKEVTRPPLYKP